MLSFICPCFFSYKCILLPLLDNGDFLWSDPRELNNTCEQPSGSWRKTRSRCPLKSNTSSDIKRNSQAAKLTGSFSSSNCRKAASKDPVINGCVCQSVMSACWCHWWSGVLSISLCLFHLLKNLQLILCKERRIYTIFWASLGKFCSLMLCQFWCFSHTHRYTLTVIGFSLLFSISL